MKRLVCAIYTRKSSDEGLDQEFNSLDAQREAGEAYVKSQASEGWRVHAARYDDGGYSGGTMERPGLKKLLADIDAGCVDIVVVYKIDRLTRSLADFARIVEQFDARGVSFVSVTQAFNTTSSMGRLTLNVLLSFAQFEREVTGERIRDKISASKAKGMWMGGNIPLGYDKPLSGSRTLEVNAKEAELVRHIFTRYLALGSVFALEKELNSDGLVSKTWTTEAGRIMGGLPFSRGALFYLLKNRLYIGDIVHKGLVHKGLHTPIIEAELFEAVADALSRRRRRWASSLRPKVQSGCLTGKIFDATGEAMTPAFAYGRNKRVYRYYVSASLQKGMRPKQDSIVRRIAAPSLERLIEEQLQATMPETADVLNRIERVVVVNNRIEVSLQTGAVIDRKDCVAQGLTVSDGENGNIHLAIPVALPLHSARANCSAGRRYLQPDPTLVAALRKAHAMLSRDWFGFPVLEAAPISSYDRNILRLAFLAPDLQRSIIEGTQAKHINLELLVHNEIPLDWEVQRALFATPK